MFKTKIFRILLPGLVLVLLAMSNSGCWDLRELENIGFISVLGIDKGPVGTLLVTADITIPRKLPGGGEKGGDGGTSLSTTLRANSIPTALNLMNSHLGRELSLMHMKAIIIGQDQARAGVQSFLGAFSRYREIRGNTIIIVTEGKAMNFITELKPVMEARPDRFLENIAFAQRFSSLVPVSQLHDFLARMQSLTGNPVAILAALHQKPEKKLENLQKSDLYPDYAPPDDDFTAGNVPDSNDIPVEFMGTAVFRGDKLVGFLTGKETKYLNILRGEFSRSFWALEDPLVKNNFVPIDLRQGALPDIKVRLDGQRPVIDVKISLEGELAAVRSKVDYTDPVLQHKLESAATETLERRATATVKKAQRLRTDIFGFGQKARRDVWTWSQLLQADWPRQFSRAEVNVKATFKLRRPGLQFKRPEAPPAKL